MYLMIRNKGVADYRGLTLIGASGTRYSSKPGQIGQFGSGGKLSIALLLRNAIRPVICAGTLKMEFFTKPESVSGRDFNRVCVKFSGKDDGVNKSSTEDLGFVLEWGVQDWSKLHMAIREFVSNAIDGAIEAGGDYKDVEFDIVDKPRAKAGYTSVFIPYIPEIETIYRRIGTMFLHFSHPEWINEKILPKQTTEDKVLIYKKGVLVNYSDGKSRFDYNLGDELTLDESRNASDWDVRYAVSQALKDAAPDKLAEIIMGPEDSWENSLPSGYLKSEYDTEETKKRRREAFQTAWVAAAGEDGVACSGKIDAGFISRKGYKPVKIAPTWFEALAHYGVKTEAEVLSKAELDGKTILPATPEMVKAVDWCWNLLETYGMTCGETKPPVSGFQKVMDAGCQQWGEYDMATHTVYLHKDLGGRSLYKVALEECVHAASKSLDNSRDIQDFLFRLVVEMAY